ncbi:MAG: ferrous iron transport protein A [Actinobacteria bacterium]|nr:ferrous iron transport protein A [Actinomycetota bacterium]
MTMDGMKRGQKFRIVSLPGETVKSQAVRFGIGEGEVVTCAGIIPAGPVVISKNRQEIAIGRGLAGRITVEPA